MATRSFIGLWLDNDRTSVKGVYCHNDGYPAHQAPLLRAHETEAAIEALISPGDMSTLAGPEYYVDMGESAAAVAPRCYELDGLVGLFHADFYEFFYIFHPGTAQWETYSYHSDYPSCPESVNRG